MNFRDVGLNSCKASGSINERQELSVKGSSFQINNHPDLRRRRNKLFESLNPFSPLSKIRRPQIRSCCHSAVPSWRRSPGQQDPQRLQYNRNRSGRVLERDRSWCCAGKEHVWVQLNQFHCRGLQLCWGRTSPTVIERNI